MRTPNQRSRAMRWMVKGLAVLTTAAFAVACGGKNDPGPDRYDLSWMDTLKFDQKAGVASALEAGMDSTTEATAAPARPAANRATTTRRTSTAARTSRTSRSTASSSSGTYRAPARTATVETKRNTARDAAIGAAGGAVIGAVAGGSRHRVKGAIIGGATGAVIGGVIGHTVDKKERVVYK